MSGFPHRYDGSSEAILVLEAPQALNHTTADEFRRETARLLPNRDDAGLVVDAAEITMITSIGIAALLQVQEHCRIAGAPMVLAAPSDVVRRMFALVRLERQFPTAPTVDEAVAMIERGEA